MVGSFHLAGLDNVVEKLLGVLWGADELRIRAVFTCSLVRRVLFMSVCLTSAEVAVDEV